MTLFPVSRARASAPAAWIALAAVGLLLLASSAALAEVPTVTVELIGFAFVPSDVTIAPGTAVRWVDTDGMFHSVSSGLDSGDPNAFLLFNEILSAEGQEFIYTFPTAGVFHYFCLFHESLEMKGKVTVSGPTSTDETSWGRIKATFEH